MFFTKWEAREIRDTLSGTLDTMAWSIDVFAADFEPDGYIILIHDKHRLGIERILSWENLFEYFAEQHGIVIGIDKDNYDMYDDLRQLGEQIIAKGVELQCGT